MSQQTGKNQIQSAVSKQRERFNPQSAVSQQTMKNQIQSAVSQQRERLYPQSAESQQAVTNKPSSEMSQRKEEDRRQPTESQQHKSKASEESFYRAMSLLSSTEQRRPTEQEVSAMAQFCVDQKFPLLSPEELAAHLGPTPTVLEKDNQHIKLFGQQKGIVVNFASSLKTFRSFLLGAVNMVAFSEGRETKRLVGVCPEVLGVVSNAAGLVHLRQNPMQYKFDPYMPFMMLGKAQGALTQQGPYKRACEDGREAETKKMRAGTSEQEVGFRRQQPVQAPPNGRRVEDKARTQGKNASAGKLALMQKMQALGCKNQLAQRQGMSNYGYKQLQQNSGAQQLAQRQRMIAFAHQLELEEKMKACKKQLALRQMEADKAHANTHTVAGEAQSQKSKTDACKKQKEPIRVPADNHKVAHETDTSKQQVCRIKPEQADANYSRTQPQQKQTGSEVQQQKKRTGLEDTLQQKQKQVGSEEEQLKRKRKGSDDAQQKKRRKDSEDPQQMRRRRKVAKKAQKKTNSTNPNQTCFRKWKRKEHPEHSRQKGEPSGQTRQTQYAIFICSSNILFTRKIRNSAEVRGPSPEEVQLLTQFCADFKIPVVSFFDEVNICMGMMPRQLPKDGLIKVFMNEAMGFILKFAQSLEMFRALLLEAYVMQLFSTKRGFQRLVGVFLETMCLVSKDAGQTLDRFPLGEMSTASRHSVIKQVCDGLQTLHNKGFLYNNLTAQHICLKETDKGLEVTLVAFGLTQLEMACTKLSIGWSRDLPYAPEICGVVSSGRCGKKSDVYSLAKLLSKVFSALEGCPTIREWVSRSQALRADDRGSLAELVRALESGPEESDGRRIEGRRPEAN